MNAQDKTMGEWVFPAVLSRIDAICAEILARLADCGEEDRFALHLLARETLNNAVLHGSKENPRLQVRCQFWREDGWVWLRVSDEGPGFDWKTCLAREESRIEDVHGRGLLLYRLYASQVEFNPAGNIVTLARRLKGCAN